MFRRLPHNLRRPRPEDIARVSDDKTPRSEPKLPRPISRNLTDVLDTIHWIQRASSYRVPNELIKLILYHAHYDCIHFRAAHNVPDRRFSTGKESSPKPYLETRPLEYLTPADQIARPVESNTERGRIRRVTVKATGHDQGWCHNKAEGSWTWFELGKKDSEDNLERGPEWAKNAVAEKTPQDHELVYDAERPEETSQEIRTWVERLQNGDSVGIVPMARFSGWSCNVLKASIDVEVEVWW